jgi:hypothetical protein
MQGQLTWQIANGLNMKGENGRAGFQKVSYQQSAGMLFAR